MYMYMYVRICTDSLLESDWRFIIEAESVLKTAYLKPNDVRDPVRAQNLCCSISSCCDVAGVVPVSYLMRNLSEGNLRMRHHYLGGNGTKPLAKALKVRNIMEMGLYITVISVRLLQENTVCEEVDLSDNYIEGEGAKAIATVLKDNMFIVNLVRASLQSCHSLFRSMDAKCMIPRFRIFQTTSFERKAPTLCATCSKPTQR